MDRRKFKKPNWVEIVCLTLVGAMLPVGGCAWSRVPQNRVASRTSSPHAQRPPVEALGSGVASNGQSSGAPPAAAVGSTGAGPAVNALNDPFYERPTPPAPAISRQAVSSGPQSPPTQAPVPSMQLARAEPKYARALTKPGVMHANAESFDKQVLQSEVPVLVDFYASWCGPCKTLAPTLEELAGESPQARVVKIDIDASPDLAARYGVKSVPSLMVFRNGQITAKQTGVASKARLKTMLEM
jgi:thioredoxin 1